MRDLPHLDVERLTLRDLAPALDTARLVLRGPRLEDLDDSAAMWGDPEVTRHIGGRPFTAMECWHRLLRYAGHWALLGYGYWVVRDRDTGRFVGEVGLADWRREVDPPLDAPEMGWALAPHAHGRGYATEAVRAVQAWASQHLGAPRTVCMIDPGNTASHRVAEKCGYRPYARTTFLGEPTVLYAATVA